MTKVQICVEIDESHFKHYKIEAERRGTTVEKLIEQMVQGLIRELREDEESGTDHPITPR
jgi:hypothetical protein